MNEGILITAYQQKDLTEQNILRVRNEYKFLHDIPIVVVSTSEVPVGFSSFEKYPNVKVLEWFTAPYNPGSDFVPTTNVNFKFVIAPRILCSIEMGLGILDNMGVTKVLHVHSDSYYKSSHENILKDTFDKLDDYYLGVDTSSLIGNILKGEINPKMLWHPEGLFLNLPLIKQIGYDKLSRYFTDRDYQSNFVHGIEFILADFFHTCVTGRKFEGKNILFDFDKYILVNNDRYPHGEFKNGLVNLSGDQNGKCNTT